MSPLLVIARHTLRSALRDRILYAFVAFGILYLLFTLFLGALSLNDLPMIRGFGLAGIYLFGIVIAIFLGSSVLAKEIDERTLYLVLSKPVSRAQVLLGKFLGLFAAVTLTVVIMTVCYLVVVAYQGGGFDAPALLAVFFQLIETALLIAACIFIGLLATPLLAAVIAAILVFVGHFLPTALQNAQQEQVGGAFLYILKGMYYLLPNLEKFNIRNAVSHSVAISGSEIWAVCGYGLLYVGLLLYLAHLVFKRTEF